MVSDVVIMNPPFTRRERIPAKKEDLEKLVPEVKGKTGYWAYFLPPSEKLLKESGTLAIVIPEEFFVGKSAQSIRKYLFEKSYAVKYIVRSAAEVAFSESAHYRDYLIVLRKNLDQDVLVLTVLKKKLEDLRHKISELAFKITEFENSGENKLNLEEIACLKITNANELIKRHRNNLKPLVGFNTAKAYTITLELFDQIKDNLTLKDLIKKKAVEIKVYNPGQYTTKTKGLESFTRKLFMSRYGARSKNVVFLIENVNDNTASIKVRKTKISFEVPITATVSSLRTYSKVRHIDLTGEEEIALIDVESVSPETLKLVGLIPLNDAIKAANDILSAYNNISSNILIARKVRITSPNFFWNAFISKKKMLGTTSALLIMSTSDHSIDIPLIIYLNSSITFLQLIAFMAETEGALVTFHGKQVWNHIHIPSIENLRKNMKKTQELFQRIRKLDVKPFFVRIKEHDPVQREIDELALEMLGLEDWKPRLDEIYDALAKELETTHKILETSRKPSKKPKITTEKKEKPTTETITKWLEKP